MLHGKFYGPPVLEKKIFEGFLPHMGLAAVLVMRQHNIHNFSFPCTCTLKLT